MAMFQGDYKLFDTTEYVDELIKQISQSRHRIYLTTTTFINDGDIPKSIIDSLIAAAKRDVKVTIAADAFTYTELRDKSLVKRTNQAKKLSQQFRQAGASFHWMGRSSLFSMTGRTHSKWCVIDDTVFAFGGINLDQRSFTNLDYMIRVNDHDLANKVSRQHEHMVKADRANHIHRSFAYSFKKDTVLVDGGLVGDSIIYRRACKLASEAKKITLVSQYCPTGKLSRILKKKDSKLYFNHWSKADGPNKLVIRYGMVLSRNATKYQRIPYLHAKFMIFEMPNGDKIALTGSHNFVYGGVLAGTREIALQTTDKKLIKQLEGFLNHYIA